MELPNRSGVDVGSGVKRLCDAYSQENSNYISWPSPMAFGTINGLADRDRHGYSVSPVTF